MTSVTQEAESLSSNETALPGCPPAADGSDQEKTFPAAIGELHRDNINRPADWRFKRALWIAAGVDPNPPDGTDEHVEGAGEYLLKRQVASRMGGPLVLPGPLQAIHGALEIYLGDDRRKWAMEAAFLAGGSAYYANAQSHVPYEVVEAYEKAFFDIRCRLALPDFIIEHVVWPGCDFPELTDVGVIWKMFAYRGGPDVLEDLIDDFIEAGREDYRYLYDASLSRYPLTRKRRRIHEALRLFLLAFPEIKASPGLFDEVLKAGSGTGSDAEEQGTAEDEDDDDDVIEREADEVGQSPQDGLLANRAVCGVL